MEWNTKWSVDKGDYVIVKRQWSDGTYTEKPLSKKEILDNLLKPTEYVNPLGFGPVLWCEHHLPQGLQRHIMENAHDRTRG